MSRHHTDKEAEAGHSDPRLRDKTVLFLFYEPFRSGICQHIRTLVQALESEEITFFIICSSDDEKIPPFFEDVIPAENIIMVPVNLVFSLKGFMATWKTIRNKGVDIVHIHNIGTMIWSYLGAVLAGSSKIVFTPHIDMTPAGRFQWFFRRMWRLFGPFTSSVIALTQQQKKWLVNWKIIDEKKITVIENHLLESDIKKSSALSPPSLPVPYNLPANVFFVTQIGRLDRQKNPLFLVEVARLLKQQCPNILFLLVGEGPLQQILKDKITEYHLQDTVFLAGHQTNISWLLEKSHIVTLTSRWEGMPFALLEAIYFKKPIIATDIPGNRHLIREAETGYLVRNEEQFAEKIQHLYHSRKLAAEMGKRGYRLNQHLFDLNRMKGLIRDVYCEVADG